MGAQKLVGEWLTELTSVLGVTRVLGVMLGVGVGHGQICQRRILYPT